MNYIVSSAQMYQAECSAVKGGASFPVLMEKAGCACADIIFDRFCNEGKNIAVLCGKGKNGGDGFVIARSLKKKGCDVRVCIPCGEPVAEDAIANYKKLEDIEIISGSDEIKSAVMNSDITVEALFGTGFKGSLSDELAHISFVCKESRCKVISVDVPAGINCDKPENNGEVFKADMTVAISALKPVHVLKPFNEFCGETVIADIGITDADILSADGRVGVTLTDNDIKNLLPERPSVSNKGTFGHALCVCGSKKMPGAACISVSSALRSGAGLVTAAFPESAYTAITSKITEALMFPCRETEEGTFSLQAFEEISEALQKATAVLAGCGLGLNSDTKRLVKRLVLKSIKPLVLDADGLNSVADDVSVLRYAKAPVAITPHPGEMSRLCGKTIAEILENPAGIAAEFADEYGCTVVLKGTNTVVAAPGEKTYFLNTKGNSGLAKGGSGDMLAGMIVSFLAQGMSTKDAAAAGVYIHSGCADLLAEAYSKRGMLVTDLITVLPVYLKKFDK